MQSCAVIGCGAAGMIASSLLRQHGLLVTCFEMSGETGGMWNGNSHDNFTECGANIPLYPSMKCVIPKDLMSFSDFRFDATTPQFAHHTAVRHYLARYSAYKGVKALTRFHTKVQSVRWDSRDRAWKLITINLHNGDVMEWTFEKVCVCTGHTHSPRYPQHIRTLLRSYVDHRHGELTHACYYKHWRECKGKRVVVIGDGVTAWEYCQGLRALGAEVFQSSILSILPTLTHNWQPTLHSTSSSFSLLEEEQQQEYQPKKNSSTTTNSSSNCTSSFITNNNTTEKSKIKKKGSIASSLSYLWSNTIVSNSSWRLVIELLGWHRNVRHGVSVVQRWLSHRYTDMSFIPQVGYPVMCDERGILFGPLPQTKSLHSSEHYDHIKNIDMTKHSQAVEYTETNFHTKSKSNHYRSDQFCSDDDQHINDNGMFVDNVDLVICATGFRAEYPFLHDDIRRILEEDKQQSLLTPLRHTQQEGKPKSDEALQSSYDTRGLYLGTLWKDNPTLAFVGIQRELLPPFMLFEAQARFVASAFTGRITIPSDANAMNAHEAMLCEQHPSLSHLYDPNGVGLHSATYFDVLQSQRSSKVSSSTVNATFTAHILRRQWWLFSSSVLRLYHAIRSLAPLKRKQQHLLFSNKI